jgi:hypothetical protein
MFFITFLDERCHALPELVGRFYERKMADSFQHTKGRLWEMRRKPALIGNDQANAELREIDDPRNMK